MKQIKIYEPAMCCSSGVCGVGVDNELLRITTKVNKMKEDGIFIERFNLSTTPQAFIENKTVQEMIAENGVDILPIVMVNDKVVITGRYPTDIELDNLSNATINTAQSTQNFEAFQPNTIPLTKYLFFTGKGGVGKTSMAYATAVQLADTGKRVLLISTDPASNLQDVFETELNNTGVKIHSVPNLTVINLNPIEAANAYKESVLAPYKNLLPKEALENMEEQLSGSCTVEIAAFNEFAHFITDEKKAKEFDFILFDTAPTGHTLRMLQLPSAWNDFIRESNAGVNCLGQLSGLGNKKAIYEKAVKTLSSKEDTTLILVTRPDVTPLQEAERASKELSMLHIDNQIMIVNGILQSYDDKLSKSLYTKQQTALRNMSAYLKTIQSYAMPLRAYNITGVDTLRKIFTVNNATLQTESLQVNNLNSLDKIVEDVYNSHKKVIFTMGKGGVGKTTIAAAIALGLSKNWTHSTPFRKHTEL